MNSDEKKSESEESERITVEETGEDTDIFDDFISGKEETQDPNESDLDEEDFEQDSKEDAPKEDFKEKEENIVEEELDEVDDLEPIKEKSDEEIEQEIHNADEEEEEIEEKPVVPDKESIKDTILQKSQEASKKDAAPVMDGLPLKFLEDPENNAVFIGRKKSFLKKYGYEGALLIGKINEEEHKDKQIYLDSLNPHVVFVCGARGSGKSYCLGVIAEELTRKNKNVGTVVIDPVGVFWSMKFPNKEEKELQLLQDWGLNPEGLDSLKVFIPDGMKDETPSNTYDATFAIQPSLLTSDDWCLTFGIERFSPTGLLLDKTLRKVEKGYKNQEEEKISGEGKNFSLDSIIECLNNDEELNSRDKGYKQDSIRALVSRFEAAKNWGIFDRKGTPLGELSVEGQMTVIDTSFLDDNVTALVIGILARRILAARKISTRKEAAKKFATEKLDDLLEVEIPPTWLFIDEAHTLIPSGNTKTPASTAIIEYVKQGRRPGCSLVFATQQPSAIDTKVLSQLDILVAHKLIFDDDIKSVYKRAPTIIPMRYKRSNFLKTLPIGVSLTSDRREETSRAFVMKGRPRLSQHEGREAETLENEIKLEPEQIEKMAVNAILDKLKSDPEIDIEIVKQAITLINRKYKGNCSIDTILDKLQEQGITVESNQVVAPATMRREKIQAEPEQTELPEEPKRAREDVSSSFREEQTELVSLPLKVNTEDAKNMAISHKKSKILGFFGDNEEISDISLKYVTIWKVSYDVYNSKKEFITHHCFIDSLKCEFIHFDGKEFIDSKGLSEICHMDQEESELTLLLLNKQLTAEQLAMRTGKSEEQIEKVLKKLKITGIISMSPEEKGNHLYWVSADIDLPPFETHEFLDSVSKLPFVNSQVLAKEREKYTKEDITKVLNKVWNNISIRNIQPIHRPVWFVELSKKNETRKLAIDGFTGQLIK